MWRTRVQDEILAKAFNSCDVTITDKSHDAETYTNFPFGKNYFKNAAKKNTTDISKVAKMYE